jgi:3-hydroxyacyl-[acyl-carrier-protein] dehydratase
MLEAMTQTGAWLIRATEDFAHSVVVLKEARNVKYADFVSPGQILTVTAEIQSHGERETRLIANGSVDGRPNVTAKLVLERFNLTDQDSDMAATDRYIVREMRKLFAVLWPGVASDRETAGGQAASGPTRFAGIAPADGAGR